MAKTANQALFEATVRHQVHVLRFAEGQAAEAAKALAQAEQELLDRIAGAMAKGLDPARLEELLKSVKERRAQVFAQMGKDQEGALRSLSEAEADWEVGSLQGTSPIELKLASVPLEQLHAAVAAPIAGMPLTGWLDSIAAAEASALQQAVTQAVLQGQTIDDLVRRIRGTKANGYSDGILSTSTRNAQALARTAVNHVSNAAREQVWEANSDVVRCLRWTATLDGRTSPICRSRDGHMAPIGGKALLPSDQPLVPAGARPPAHFQCRSVLVAVLDGVELAGDRPFVADARVRKDREAAFRKEAKERGVPVAQVRKEWADKHVGQVPSATTYGEWLKTQPKQFQDELLGRGRAELFRSGVPLERFVDKSGKTLSLAELKAELAGDSLNVLQPAIGVKAKGLLMQGLAPDDVLAAIKSEFPGATTSAASIASYKSELNKAGLLPKGLEPSMKQLVVNADTSTQLSAFEAKLPPGLKGAVQGQWASVVESLDGHPGAYAHYKPGVGVQLSDSKMVGLSKAQAQQVMAHELGHLLDKVHGLSLDAPDLKFMLSDLKELDPQLYKLYSYYATSPDELWAEVVGQALHDGPVTSQGVDATAFKGIMSPYIDAAKKKLAEKFPDLPPAMPSGPVMSGAGEVAGKPMSIGGYAKALLQQGMPDQQVLDAVMAEFPSAKTTMNSIKSYKSELKKVEKDAIGKAGPTVQAKASASIGAPQPLPPSAGATAGFSDPAAQAPKPTKDAVPLSGLTKVGGKPGGSNPGAVYADAKGDQWLVKGNLQKANGSVTAELSDARARNEVLAARLLRFADPALAPEMRLVDLEGQYGGGLGVASKMLGQPIIKFDPNDMLHVGLARQDFALHAWLGNYDAVGASFDNLVIKSGKAVNIDPGGALLFRAQGLPKSDFGAVADTWTTMRDAKVNAQAAKVYGGMTDAELRKSAKALLKFSDEVIDEMVSAMGPGVPVGDADLAKLLKARRDDILKKAGLQMPKAKAPPAFYDAASTAAAPAPPAIDPLLLGVTDFQKGTLKKIADTITDLPASSDPKGALDDANKIHSWLPKKLTFADLDAIKAGALDVPEAAAAAPAASAVSYKQMTPKELMDALVAPELKLAGWEGPAKKSFVIQKAAVPLFKAGLSTDKVYEVLELKFPGMSPKPASLASMKSKLKKAGLLDGPPASPSAPPLPQPKLWGKALGSKSSTVKDGAKNLIQQGESAPKVVEWIGSQFSTPNAQGAQDLYELAHYEVKTGKMAAKPGVAAAAPKEVLAAPVPLRPATNPGEAGPPPPRFTKEGWRAGLRRYGGSRAMSDSNLAKINASQKAAGLEPLEPEEYAAVKAYTGSAYGQVNLKLREGEFAGDVYLQAWTDAAMQGLYKLPAWSGDVVRGMSVNEATVAQLKQFYRVGSVVRTTQFTSTSAVARGGKGFGGNVKYYIKVKNGKDVKPISSYKSEEEILLAPGTSLKVLRVEPLANAYGPDGFEVYLEEV